MKKRTTEEFIELARQVHGDKYDYSKTVYVNKRSKVIITCPIHGDFEQNAHSHLNGRGCPKCGVRKSSKTRLTKTEKFIEKCRQKHGDKYSYDKVVFTKSRDKVIITCPIHGDFEQRASHHLSGQGCPKCCIEKRKNSVANLLERFNRIHNNFYQYNIVGSPRVKDKITIICPQHGPFLQTVGHHLRGEGCPECMKKKISISRKYTQEIFLKKANSIHNSYYTYRNDYTDSKTKIQIICPKHGVFTQTPDAHLQGQGCPHCGNNLSNAETEIFNMLSTLNPIQRERTILNGREIDIYLPSHKLGIEYHGLRWHTDFFGGKGRTYHLSKLNDCLYKGVNLIQIFEDEYMNNREIVLNKISHIVGLDNAKPKIFARKCVVHEITKDEAKEFLNRNHIQGFASASLYLGLKYEGSLIAVMTFLEESEGYWNLNRFATEITHNCIGAGGKLFKYFIRNYEFKEIKSFADRRWTINYDNNLYTKLGFENVGFTPANYTYYNPKVEKYKRFHKFGFRKQTLHKKYGLPLSMTESEMIKELGYDRIWDCGLIKYVYKQTNQ